MNSFVYDYIISNIFLKYNDNAISLFDVGFGIGLFLRMFLEKASKKYARVYLEGCEPSKTSFEYFINESGKEMNMVAHHETIADVKTLSKFDVITAVYVMPAVLFEDIEHFAKKVYLMLNKGGRFYCVIAAEKSYKDSKNNKDLFTILEKNNREYKGKHYTEFLHKSLLPGIGYVFDYNRDEDLYADIFSQNGFWVEEKKEIDDGYFLNTLFIFKK